MRYIDWTDRLTKKFQKAATQTFEWGTHDCILFAADCVEAITGIDPAKSVRGRYTSEEEANILMQEEFGGGTIEEVMDHGLARHNFIRIASAFAQRGDLVAVKTQDVRSNTIRPVAGVIDLTGRNILLVTEKGFIQKSNLEALTAWRIA